MAMKKKSEKMTRHPAGLGGGRVVPPGPDPADEIMAERVRRGYWYWCSVLSGVLAVLKRYSGLDDDKITGVIYTFLKDMAAMTFTDGIAVIETRESVLDRIGRRLPLHPYDSGGPAASSYLTAALSGREAQFRAAWKERAGGNSSAGYTKDRKALIAWLENYISVSDADGLFLTECISVDDSSQAPARLYAFLEANGQKDEEAMTTGIVLLALEAVRTALQIDALLAGLDPEGEFMTMLRNTLAEYRNVDMAAAQTWEIYKRDYTAQTGGQLMLNAYKVMLAKMMLDGTDHVYEPYADALGPAIRKALDEAGDVGTYREIVFGELSQSQGAYDLAHPKSVCFYTRAAMRPLVLRLNFRGICRMFAQSDDWEKILEEDIGDARLDHDRDRFVRGDFTFERMLDDGDLSFANLHSGQEFEEYLQRIFTRLGYDARLTDKAGGDQGADLILRKQGFTYVVQAKFYEKPVGNKAVQEVSAALRWYGASLGIVVTNSTYTKSARSLAVKNRVTLIDGDQLKSLVKMAYSERALTHFF